MFFQPAQTVLAIIAGRHCQSCCKNVRYAACNFMQITLSVTIVSIGGAEVAPLCWLTKTLWLYPILSNG
jgi:hypothetical protein